ncbi:MAG: radical SAM protein, partial [Alistipes senegalensis]|nr:radical SAM protein [Alistipes senegalensis]
MVKVTRIYDMVKYFGSLIVTENTPYWYETPESGPSLSGDGPRDACGGSPHQRGGHDGGRSRLTPSYTAYFKIAEGCSNRCTYCAIPSIRGRMRSRTMESIVAEARELCDMGIKELCIIAQDTTSYGIDLYGRLALSELLEKLLAEMNVYNLCACIGVPSDEADEHLDRNSEDFHFHLGYRYV